jgi:hypothetical protein
MAARKRVDYERIEAGWRAGLLSPRQLAAAYTEETGDKVSHAAIIKYFTEHDIPRDLSAKIHAKADALVTAAMVTGKVTPDKKIPEKRIVEEGAATVTQVRLAQRVDIERCRRICMGLMAELEQQSTSPDTLSEAAAILRSAPAEELTKDQRAKLAEAANKASSLGARSSTMRALSESLRVLIGMERQAYGIRDEMPEPPAKGMEQVSTAELLAMRDALKGRA